MRTTALFLVFVAACGSVSRGDDDVSDDDVTIDAPTGNGPVLDAIAPDFGRVTDEVTLTGSNFGASEGTSTVDFGTIEAQVVTWTDGEIVVRVPDILPGPYDVSVTTAGGVSGTQPFMVVLPPMVYINNDVGGTDGFDSVGVMRIDPQTGALTDVGAVSMGVAATGYGGCSSSIWVDYGHRRVYATGNSAVAGFDIDPVTGALTPIAGSPFTTGGTQGYGVIVDPGRNAVLVADYSGFVHEMTIGANGALTPAAGSPHSAPGGVDTVVTDGPFVYANTESNQFYGFDANFAQMTGSPFQTGTYHYEMDVRPGRHQLYLPTASEGLRVFALAAGTGIPTPIAGSPFTIPVPSGGFNGLTFADDGDRLYLGTDGGSHILGFDLAANGTPTAIAGSPWSFAPAMTDISCIAASRNSAYLFALDETAGTVAAFSLAANGTPTQVPGSPFTHAGPQEASGIALTF